MVMILLIAGHCSIYDHSILWRCNNADYSALYIQYQTMSRTWFVSKLVYIRLLRLILSLHKEESECMCKKLPIANPIASFPTRWDMTGSGSISRSSDVSCSIISFVCTASIAVWSAGIVVRTTIHGIAKPVPCQHLICSVICGWIRASVFWVSTTMACIPPFEIRVLAGTAHPISSWPAHDFSVFIKNRIRQDPLIFSRIKDGLYSNVIMLTCYAYVPDLYAYTTDLYIVDIKCNCHV